MVIAAPIDLSGSDSLDAAAVEAAARRWATHQIRRHHSTNAARYDAKMTAGAAAADIRMGKYDNWIGPERIVLNVQRYYDEFFGRLTPDVNTAGIQRTTEEYNAARKGPWR